MTSAIKIYQQELHNKLGYFAIWLPADGIELGDVGFFEGSTFRRETSIRELGFPDFQHGIGDNQQLNFSSTHQVAFDPQAKASVLNAAHMAVDFLFGQEGSFLFHANKLTRRFVQNRGALERWILDQYKGKLWHKKWCVVDSVHDVDFLTVMLSFESRTRLTIEAKIEGDISGLNLANPKLEAKVTSVSGNIAHIICEEGLTPLFNCVKLSTSYFSEHGLRAVRGSDANNQISKYFIRPTVDEVSNRKNLPTCLEATPCQLGAIATGAFDS